MSEKFNIEVDSDFIKNFFELGDMPAPDSVTPDSLNKALGKIKTKIATLVSANNFNAANNNSAQTQTRPGPENTNHAKNILVVDDLGIVTIQMETVLRKLGFNVTVSKELFDAIEKYKAQDFGYTVIDLFIPTEREGFMLIDEIKKMSLLCKLNTKIIVMTASNKKEHREKCMNRGADYFVEKMPGWQKVISEICTGEAG